MALFYTKCSLNSRVIRSANGLVPLVFITFSIPELLARRPLNACQLAARFASDTYRIRVGEVVVQFRLVAMDVVRPASIPIGNRPSPCSYLSLIALARIQHDRRIPGAQAFR